MEHSFHGRTFGALSVTGNAHYREDFEPMIGNIRFATLNDIESVKANINEKTCAIILETVQGEGGIYPASEEFLKEIRKICDEKDILMILDEIQCGMGRTGYMFAWEKYGVKPDIMLSAKALGCGIPVGAILFNKKVAENSLVPGDHGTTYGGNPLATRAVYEVLKLYEKEKIVDHVNEVGPYLYEKLEELKENNPHIKAHRGVGLMQGIEIDLPLKDVLNKTLEKGVVLISAGSNLIRFVPPLIIKKEDIDKMIAVLSEVLND
ncbi:MAG TPA: aspartate aminotransferase family protein, partial [Lachnospiraceae bacterium]|nr:aspartate aminotransferase family protein [Lachnospiraceae bacterium]